MNREILEGKTRIHFIGAGGSGIFPLEQILLGMGYRLSGSDNNETETLDLIRSLGSEIHMGHRAENVEGADIVVYSSAIMKDNPEIVEAKRRGIPLLERKDLLGLVTRWYPNAVCFAGTHGKTTATSMAAQILYEWGDDFGCVIGGKLPIIGGSGRAGASPNMVCEADEYVDTFLKLSPDISVILNIDADHMEYFKTLDNLKNSFKKFATNATRAIVYNGGDKNTADAVGGIEGKEKVTFGWGEENDYHPENIVRNGLETRFDVIYKGKLLMKTAIHVPGRHNVLNALAAIAAMRITGVPDEVIERGISGFKGAMRRFEKIAEAGGVTVCDDYAHHPAEIKATLGAAKELGFKRIIAVHQPFTYSRTKRLLNEFADALSMADEAVITEIMGSREINTYGVCAADLAAITPNCTLTPTFEECADYLEGHVGPGDLVITLGCGDIYKVAKELGRRLTENRT